MSRERKMLVAAMVAVIVAVVAGQAQAEPAPVRCADWSECPTSKYSCVNGGCDFTGARCVKDKDCPEGAKCEKEPGGAAGACVIPTGYKAAPPCVRIGETWRRCSPPGADPPGFERGTKKGEAMRARATAASVALCSHLLKHGDAKSEIEAVATCAEREKSCDGFQQRCGPAMQALGMKLSAYKMKSPENAMPRPPKK